MNPIYVALVLISAATLAFQVALTRFFALAQGSHLAFMAVSLALLGAGASGTYLSLKPVTRTNLPQLISVGAILFAVSVPASYLTINYLPFDAYRLAWERLQLLWLTLYYLALTVPFFFNGLVIGAALAAQPERSGPLYAANLLGSSLGPLLALFALAAFGGPGTLFFCALLGWLAAASGQGSVASSLSATQGRSPLPVPLSASRFPLPASRPPFHVSRFPLPALRFAIFLFITIALLYLTLRPPSLFDVRLTPYKALFQARLYPGSELIFSEWNAFSRVDILRSEGIRSAPGLSFAYPGQLPPQLGLTVDGDNLAPITRPTQLTFTAYLPLALGFELRPGADVLILEPGGGLAVLTALHAQGGVRSVTLVQSNHTVAEAVGQRLADFTGNLYADPRVTVVIDDPRSFLRRTEQQFDLVILPLTDSFRPVTAGAYTLNEDYRYTVEAFSDALAHLTPNGLLLVERWLQLPPSESLRLWGTAVAALREQMNCEAGACVELVKARLWAVRSLQTSLIGVSAAPLAEADLAKIREFARTRQFDLVWLTDIQPAELNRYSVVPNDPYYHTFADLLAAPHLDAFAADYTYAVAPPTDDHPYFFHFFKWQQIPEIWQTLGKTWQPFGGSGYLVLVVLLSLIVILSAGLILLPLLVTNISRGARGLERPENGLPLLRPPMGRFLLYFALLGLGFLFVEIPLLQRFILYLGQPAYAFAIVVSALLAAAGVGSAYLSPRLSLRVALPLITLLAISYPWLLTFLFEATLQLPFAGRVAITVLAIFPLGILLGVPFPRGLRLVARTSPQLVPWVWAVNGCASVISAILAAMLALTWGFSTVVWGAAVAYALAAFTIHDQLQFKK